jgi:quercetin dioxygenase-like cupin family protein
VSYDINKLFLPIVFVNGKLCKDPKLANANDNDLFFQVLNIPRNIANQLKSNFTLLNVDKILGLNALGISLIHLEYALYCLNPPHTHPRPTEILEVVEGSLYVGFVKSNPDNRLFTKTLNMGDIFVFPIGLIHFQFNVGKTNVVAFASLGSQNLGLIAIAKNVFGANPPINPDVLIKAFQLDKNVVDSLQKKFVG